MAEKKTTQDIANQQETAAVSKAAAPEYTVDEVAEAAGVFGATPDLVRAAFAVAEKSVATEDEARKLINRFKKEVK